MWGTMFGEMKKSLGKIANLLICLFVFFVMAIPLHEAGHALVAQIFGVGGYIIVNWLTFSGVFLPESYSIPMWQEVIIYFAGGGFVAAIYGILLLFANVGQKWDADDQTALRLVLGMQLGYGIGETFLIFAYYSVLEIGGFVYVVPDYSLFQVAILLGTVLGGFVALVCSYPSLRRWYIYDQ